MALADAVRQLVENAVVAPAQLTPLASDVAAQAIVGAGDSLANWWLEHPEIPREQLADWYVQVVQASIRAIVTRSGTKGRR